MRRPGVRRDGPFPDQIDGPCRPSQHGVTASRSGHISVREITSGSLIVFRMVRSSSVGNRAFGGGFRCSRRRSAGGDGGTSLFRSARSDEDGGRQANIAASGASNPTERDARAAQEESCERRKCASSSRRELRASEMREQLRKRAASVGNARAAQEENVASARRASGYPATPKPAMTPAATGDT
jgi:hypothetical protein